MPNKYYITTAIPYVNAKPHIGFALELVQADAIARQKRQDGNDVFFLTGTDDNSLKNVQAAEKAGLATKDFVDQNASLFQNLTKALNISNDAFIRTASADHFRGAQKLWSACDPDDIYKKKYKGLYCVGCEVFYTESELIDGRCPEHHTVPEEVEEENYFFKLSKYQDKLEKHIADDVYHIVPDSRKKEILSFIRMGLTDFSISRSVARAKNWGVPVPGDPSQIMYVWFDALSNYITALGYGGDEKRWDYWPTDLHVIGKGIIRFHAVYWPVMLMSAGISLPKQLFVHGYVNVGGEKMSKSLGNVVDPFELVEKYGVDAVRFYLLKHMHPFEDSDFTIAKFEEAYNADLANGLGNLVARVTNMIEKSLGGNVTRVKHYGSGKLGREIGDMIEKLNFREAMLGIWRLIDIDNVYIDTEKPWALAKSDPKKIAKILGELTDDLFAITAALRPFMPDTSEKIEKHLTSKPIVKYSGLFARIQT